MSRVIMGWRLDTAAHQNWSGATASPMGQHASAAKSSSLLAKWSSAIACPTGRPVDTEYDNWFKPAMFTFSL
jgi:hypothetical protein